MKQEEKNHLSFEKDLLNVNCGRDICSRHRWNLSLAPTWLG